VEKEFCVTKLSLEFFFVTNYEMSEPVGKFQISATVKINRLLNKGRIKIT
jgi:hypothetical protein